MSYSFSGTGQWMVNTSATPLTATSGYTMVAWVKQELLGADGVVCTSVNYDGGYSNHYLQLVVDSSEQPCARVRDSTAGDGRSTLAASLSTTEWTLIHGTFNSTASRIAGTAGANFATADTLSVSSFVLTPNRIILGSLNESVSVYKGRIALVAWYSVVLSNAELLVLNTVQPESAASYANCVAYWDFRTDSLVNRKNPGTYDLSAVGSPTFNASDYPTLTSGAAGRNLLLGVS